VRNQNGYLAGSDQQRADDFNDMFKNRDVKAILCSRGGYGCSRILPLIDFDQCRRHPKIVIGYSDVTILQLALFRICGLVTFSGPMVAIDIGKGLDPLTEGSFWQQISRPVLHSYILEEGGYSPVIYQGGAAEGRLLGGCLTSINSLLGTPFLPDFTGCILVLEDIGEDVYKIDRYFNQLFHAGILHCISGLIMGQFIDCEEEGNPNASFTIEQVIRHYTKDLNIPVMANLPYGHGEQKYTLPLGCLVRLDASRGEIKMLETGLNSHE